MVRQLAEDLPRFLRMTTRLRYGPMEYVRRLAAKAVGFLFRHARPASRRAGLRTLLTGVPCCEDFGVTEWTAQSPLQAGPGCLCFYCMWHPPALLLHGGPAHCTAAFAAAHCTFQ